MTLYNRRQLAAALESNMPVPKAGRCTGKTTAAILLAIHDSIKSPGVRCVVEDPDALSGFERTALMAKTQRIVEAVLTDTGCVRVGLAQEGVYVINNFNLSL